MQSTSIMPSSEAILELLHAMTRGLVPLAVAWHVVLAVIAIALLRDWRPSTRLGAIMLAGPVISASIAAMAYGNSFNAISFAVLAVLLGILAGLRTERRATPGPEWAVSLGIALILYGWVYPGFVAGSVLRAAIAAPVGIVPCPTLAVIAGFTLVAGGFGSRAIPALLVGWTAFYALFGIFVLDVMLDSGLVLAAGALIALTAHNSHQHSDHGAAYARMMP